MLVPEYNYLNKNITCLKRIIRGIKKKMDVILQREDRYFKVTYNNKQYDLLYPVTPEEKRAIDMLRSELINNILKDCIKESVDNPYADNDEQWDMVFAFVMGHPIEHYQVTKEEVEVSKDEKREVITLDLV